MAFANNSLTTENSTVTVSSMLELVKTSDTTTILRDLNKLKTQGNLSELSKQIDERGNCFLHLAVLHHDVAAVEKFLEMLGDVIFDMHLRTNHKGITAMQIAETFPESQKAAMHNLLLPTAMHATERCLNDDSKPLDYETVLKKFSVNPDSKLAENLKLGCDAVNYCKQVGLKSSTHPRTNLLSTSEHNEINRKIYLFRKNHSQQPISFANFIDDLKQEGCGNCHDSAFLSANFLYSQKKKYTYEAFGIDNTRNKFIAINLKEGAILASPATWGIDARLIYVGDCNNSSSLFYVVTDQSQLFPTLYSCIGKINDVNDPDSWEVETLVDCGNMKSDYSVEAAYFTNGDHVFGMLDNTLENQNQNEKQYTYGPNVVIFDGWSFNVFPANRMENLKDYYNIMINGKSYNFLCDFNPRHHRIATQKSFNIPLGTFRASDPDLLSKEMMEKKKAKLASMQEEKEADKKDSDASSSSNLTSKLSKKAKKPLLVLENKNEEFKGFISLHALCNLMLTQYQHEQKEKEQSLRQEKISKINKLASEIVPDDKWRNDTNPSGKLVRPPYLDKAEGGDIPQEELYQLEHGLRGSLHWGEFLESGNKADTINQYAKEQLKDIDGWQRCISEEAKEQLLEYIWQQRLKPSERDNIRRHSRLNKLIATGEMPTIEWLNQAMGTVVDKNPQPKKSSHARMFFTSDLKRDIEADDAKIEIPTVSELNKVIGANVVTETRKGIFSSEAFEMRFDVYCNAEEIENIVNSKLLANSSFKLKIEKSSIGAGMIVPKAAFNIFNLNLKTLIGTRLIVLGK